MQDSAIVLKLEAETLDIRIPYDVRLLRILRATSYVGTEWNWEKIGSISEPEAFAARPMSNVFLGMDEVLKFFKDRDNQSQIAIQSFDRNTYNPRALGDVGTQVGSIEDVFIPTESYLSFELGYRQVNLNYLQFDIKVLTKNNIHFVYLNGQNFFGIAKKDESTECWYAYAVSPVNSQVFTTIMVLVLAYLTARQRIKVKGCDIDSEIIENPESIISKCKELLTL